MVEELGKVDWQPCVHHARGKNWIEGSCRVYENRPESCANYRCAWLDGWGDWQDRPDRLGVIFSLMFSEELGGTYMLAHELWTDALESESAKRFVRERIGRMVVFQIVGDGMRKLIGGPAALVAAVMRTAALRGELTVNGSELDVDSVEQLVARNVLPRADGS